MKTKSKVFLYLLVFLGIMFMVWTTVFIILLLKIYLQLK